MYAPTDALVHVCTCFSSSYIQMAGGSLSGSGSLQTPPSRETSLKVGAASQQQRRQCLRLGYSRPDTQQDNEK